MSSETIAESTPSPPDGLLVVTVDRLPAWMLPAYGATWVAMPAIDALAARGVVFDRVITPSTAPAETCRDLAGTGDRDGPSVMRAAAERGWSVALVTDDPSVAEWLSDVDGMHVTLVPAVAKRDEAVEDGATELARLVAAAIDVIRSGRHRVVWCHVASLGVVWDAPQPYRDRYVDPEDPPPPAGAGVPSFGVDADTDPDLIVGARQAFAGQLSLLDAEIGRLFATVLGGGGSSAMNAAPGWAALFAGVRGLPLGLHGWVGVGGEDVPHGELVHVPAILVDAAGRMAAQRYGGLVLPADLGSTLAELIAASPSRPPALEPDVPWRGASLAGLFEDWSVVARDRIIVGEAEAGAIITPSWHCLFRRGGAAAAGSAGIRLFAKPDDFFELTDVANRCPTVVEPLAAFIARAAAGDWRALWREALPEAPPG